MSLLQLLRETIAVPLRYGLYPLVRSFLARGKATIIVYHDPKPEVLERHLAFFAKRYNFVTMDRLAEAIHSGDWTGMPAHPLVVTLDDGRRGNIKLLEVFDRFGVRPTLYVCSQIVGTRRRYWFYEPCIKSPDDLHYLKQVPNEQRLKVLKERAGFDQEHTLSTEEERPALSVEELSQLKGSVDIGSHTRFHPILTTCTDDECQREISASWEDIRRTLGVEPRHFAYPNGDHTKREREMARAAGYATARTLDVGWNSVNTDPYALRITGVTDSASVNLLASQLTGLPGYIRLLAQGSLVGKKSPIQPKESQV